MRHGSMDGRNAQTAKLAMKNSDIAETNNWFGVLDKLGKIKFVNDPNAAVTSSGHPNGIDIRTIHVFLNDGGTECITSSGNVVNRI